VQAQLATVPPYEIVSEQAIRTRAHRFWVERGRQEQSSDCDWQDAEETLWNDAKEANPAAFEAYQRRRLDGALQRCEQWILAQDFQVSGGARD
jgi:hypothetical protein